MPLGNSKKPHISLKTVPIKSIVPYQIMIRQPYTKRTNQTKSKIPLTKLKTNQKGIVYIVLQKDNLISQRVSSIQLCTGSKITDVNYGESKTRLQDIGSIKKQSKNKQKNVIKVTIPLFTLTDKIINDFLNKQKPEITNRKIYEKSYVQNISSTVNKKPVLANKYRE